MPRNAAGKVRAGGGIERHGFEAIAQAARNAVTCESEGETEEAREWRHIEDAMKIMPGPHQI
jgi:hypothetical protein